MPILLYGLEKEFYGVIDFYFFNSTGNRAGHGHLVQYEVWAEVDR